MAQPSDLPSKDLKESDKAEAQSAILTAGDLPQVQADLQDPTEVAASLQEGLGEDAAPVDEDLADIDESALPDDLIEAAAAELANAERDLIKEGIPLNDPDFTPEKDLIAEPGEERPLPPGLSEFSLRAAENFGQNPEVQEKIVQSLLGNDFATRVRDGEVEFRKKGSKKWFPTDRAAFTGGFREVLLDVGADLSGELLETFVGAGTESAMIAGGAKLGGAIGTPAGPLGLAGGAGAGAVAGAAAGIPAAAATSTVAREAAVAAFTGNFDNERAAEEFKLNVGASALTLGMGIGLKAGLKRLVVIMKGIAGSTPKNVVKELATIRQSFEQFRNAFGKVDLTPREAGEKLMGAISVINRDLRDRLGLIRNDFKARAGNQPFLTQRYVEGLRTNLERLGIKGEELPILLSEGKAGASAMKSRLDDLVDADVLGDGELGASLAEKMLKELQFIQKNGGLTPQELFDKTQFWRRGAGFSPKTGKRVPFVDEAQVMSEELRNALSADELDAMTEAFGNTAKASFLQNVKNEYAAKIGAIRELKTIYKSKKSAERFTKAVVTAGRSDLIRDLKVIFGEGSEELQLVRAEWLDSLYRKTVDPATGVVRQGRIQSEIDKLGPDVVRELMTERELQALKLINGRAQKVPLLKPATNAADQQFARDGAAVLVLNTKSAGIATRALWHFSRGNKQVADYLADDGLLKIATDLKDPNRKKMMFDVIEGFRALVSAARPTVRKVKGEDITMLKRLQEDFGVRKAVSKKKLLETQKLTGQVVEKEIAAPGVGTFGTSEALQEIQE